MDNRKEIAHWLDTVTRDQKLNSFWLCVEAYSKFICACIYPYNVECISVSFLMGLPPLHAHTHTHIQTLMSTPDPVSLLNGA